MWYRRIQPIQGRGAREVIRLTSFSFCKKTVFIIALASLSLSLLFSLTLTSFKASAKASDNPEIQATDFAYFQALRKCISGGWYKNAGGAGMNSMSQQNAIDFEWFNGRAGINTNETNVGAFLDPRGVNGDGRQNCGDSEGATWIKKIASQWGYSSGPSMLCDLGFTRQSNGIACAETPEGVTNDFIAPSGGATGQLDALYKKQGYAANDVSSIENSGGLYALLLANFKSQCKLGSGGSDYTIQEWDSVQKDWVEKKYGAADRDRGKNYAVNVYEGRQMSCGELASSLSDKNSSALKGYKNYYAKRSETPPAGGAGVAGSTTNPAESGTSCAIEGVGWIVCPVATFIGQLNDGLWAILQNFLKIQPSMFDVNGDTYRTWGYVRNIANVAFVIVFIIIIFSQLTGAGVSNYGVKKMLPRLIIAAVLVNVSFIICAIAVDISNVVGYSLHSILTNWASGSSTNFSLGSPVTSWSDAFAWLLAGGVGTWAGITIASTLGTYGLWASLALLLPTAIAALMAFLLVVILLLARQAFVIILTVIAPLAFVAYLLPNTNQWFDRWRKFFVTLLIMFPSVALLFGGSELAAGVIRAAASPQGGEANAWLMMGSLAITALPLFALPTLMKTTGGVMNRIAGFVNNPNRGPIDKLKKRSEDFTKREQGRRAIRALRDDKMFGGKRIRKSARREAIMAGIEREAGREKNQYIANQLSIDPKTNKPVSPGFANQVAGGTPGRYGSPASDAALTRALASAKLTIDKAVAEEVEAEGVMVRNFDATKLKTALANHSAGLVKLTDAQHAAHLQRLIKVSDAPDYEKEVDNVISKGGAVPEVVRRATAQALAADGPKWVKGSDIDQIATGSHKKSFAQITHDNVRDGVMSQEKIADETSGNLKYAFDKSNVRNASGGNDAQLLVNAAASLKVNPSLSGKIKHNAKAIDNISNGRTP